MVLLVVMEKERKGKGTERDGKIKKELGGLGEDEERGGSAPQKVYSIINICCLIYMLRYSSFSLLVLLFSMRITTSTTSQPEYSLFFPSLLPSLFYHPSSLSSILPVTFPPLSTPSGPSPAPDTAIRRARLEHLASLTSTADL